MLVKADTLLAAAQGLRKLLLGEPKQFSDLKKTVHRRNSSATSANLQQRHHFEN